MNIVMPFTSRVNTIIKTIKSRLGMVKTKVRSRYIHRTPEKREEILEYIKRFLDGKGYSPTIREIQGECDISSTSVVVRYLSDLEDTKAITREVRIPRTIRVL